MMTIQKMLRHRLIGNGLFEADANKIIEQYLASETGKLMAGRMNDETKDYPPHLIKLVWLDVRRETLKWIDANYPNHWARSMFEHQS